MSQDRGLSTYQWIVLWEIADHPQHVWRRDQEWFIKGARGDHKITLQVRKLWQRHLVEWAPPEDANVLRVTEAGIDAVEARDYEAVLARWNLRDNR